MECRKGSEWRKWDLQVHTLGTAKNDIFTSANFEDFCIVFFKKAIEKEVAAVGITDYFSIENYKKIVSFVNTIDAFNETADDGTPFFTDNEKEKIKEIFLLPNVELRIMPSTNSGRLVNIHCLFNPSFISSIENNFFNSIEYSASPGNKFKMNKQGMIDLGKSLDPTLCGEAAYKKGVNTFAVSHGDLQKLYDGNIKFRENVIIAVSNSSNDGASALQKHYDLFENDRESQLDAVRKSLYCLSKAIFSSNDSDRMYFLGEKADDEKTVVQKCGSLKPCIHGSDAHTECKLFNPDKNLFCWIKSDPTFEGFKQILFEPKYRVSIQTNKPIAPNNIISSITFNIPEGAKVKVKQKNGSYKEDQFCFAGLKNTFHLSPYFNCFIGGRGSGKSTILNFLGLRSNNHETSSQFWGSINPSFSPIDLEIFSFDGVQVFEFIGQSEIESFATNRESFTEAIYQRANLQSNGKLDASETELSKVINEIRSYESIINSLEELVSQRSAKIIEKKTMESGIKITKSGEYPKIIEKITKKTNTKQELLKWRTAVKELRDSINTLQDKHFSDHVDQDQNEEVDPGIKILSKPYREAIEKAKADIQVALDLLADANFRDLLSKEITLNSEIEGHEKELSELLTKAGLTEENVIQIKSAPQKIVTLTDEIKQLDNSIGDKEKELKNYEKSLSDLEKAKNEYEKIINDSIKPLVTILESQAKENKKEDIKNIDLSYFFDDKQAWIDIANKFYEQFAEQHRDRERSDSLKKYIIDNKKAFSNTAEKISELLKKEEDQATQAGYIKFLKDVFCKEANFNIFRIIRDARLNNVIDYKRIQVLYDNKDIGNASFGQKCTAVMVILLLFGNYPLIVDEPEAHLDSSLIANYLVPLIKRKKPNRQLLFATHNANFVVNGDAEKIFVLKNETGLTEIIETTIEDLDKRFDLLKLEGGKEAFQKRERKYSFDS